MKLNAAKTLAAIARESYISTSRVNFNSAVSLLRAVKIATFRSILSGSMFYAAVDFAREGFEKVTT